ncbi:hypothetical protein GWK47_015980 [Chionoecetes opilio]|uniref:Uncharacterized protein n=1 Tax=Chionoecetes opilio TaxID=41210 RepID=A0A8J4XSW0_CHIOP|nr:hypothetical protein GWK47_015980 [Chionoecetes opilio]
MARIKPHAPSTMQAVFQGHFTKSTESTRNKGRKGDPGGKGMFLPGINSLFRHRASSHPGKEKKPMLSREKKERTSVLQEEAEKKAHILVMQICDHGSKAESKRAEDCRREGTSMNLPKFSPKFFSSHTAKVLRCVPWVPQNRHEGNAEEWITKNLAWMFTPTRHWTLNFPGGSGELLTSAVP